MKRWTSATTGSPYYNRMASIVMDSPRTLFFCVSRKSVMASADRKVLSGETFGMMSAWLWNCISYMQYWIVLLCEFVLEYSHDLRQKNIAMITRSAV